MEQDIKEIKAKTVSGVFWRLSERVLAQLISFIVSIVLARILMPEEYGVIALIVVFINIANAFVTNGMGTSLVQKKDSDEVDFSTMFYTGFAMSLLLYAILFAIAPAISTWYNNPQLCILLRVMGIRLPIAAINSIQQAYVSKKMIYKKFFFSTLIGTVVSGVVGIVMAVKGFGVWALVVQYLTNSVMDTVILFLTVSWKPKLQFSFKKFKELFSYGYKIMLTGVIGTVFDQLKNLIIGIKYTATDLAFYNRGEQIPAIAYNNLNATFESVLFPAMSAVQNVKENVKNALRSSIKSISYIIFPIMFGIAVTSESLVEIILTEKWLPCVPYIIIICIQYGLGVVSNIHLQSIKALGKGGTLLKLEFIKKPLYLSFILIGMQFSPLAIVIGGFIYSFVGWVINAIPNKKLLNYSVKEQVIDVLPTLLITLIMTGVCYLIKFLNLSIWATLIIQVLVGVIVYFALSIVFKIYGLYYILDIIKNSGIYTILKKISAKLFRLKIFKIRKKKIVFDNFNGKGYGENPKYIAEELIKQKPDLDLVWLVNNMQEDMPKEIRKVKYGSIKALYEHATAKVWIDNVRNSKGIKKKKNQFYIQTWHGGIALKGIEKDVEEFLSPQYVKEAKEDSKMTDLILTNNTNQQEYIKKYFWYDGEVLCVGTPKCDIIYNTPTEIKEKVNSYFEIDDKKKIVVYAPTFRNGNDISVYEFDYKQCCKVLKEKFKEDFVMLIRLHPNVSEYSNKINYDDNIKNATNYPDMQELLATADVVITDYSSVQFEAALANKPVFIFAKDLKEYIEKERKLIFKFEEIPFNIAKSEEELYNNIQKFSQEEYNKKCEKFYNSIGVVNNSNSSKEVVNIILKQINKGSKKK